MDGVDVLFPILPQHGSHVMAVMAAAFIGKLEYSIVIAKTLLVKHDLQNGMEKGDIGHRANELTMVPGADGPHGECCWLIYHSYKWQLPWSVSVSHVCGLPRFLNISRFSRPWQKKGI